MSTFGRDGEIVSGHILAFATATDFVIQWFGEDGWKAKNLGAYVSLSPPSGTLDRNDLPYKFFGSAWQSSLELVIPLEKCENATCDSSFWVAVYLDSLAGDEVTCPGNVTDNSTDCHGEQPSWLDNKTAISASACCCFDSSEYYSAFAFSEVSFETATLKRGIDVETALTSALAELLHVSANSILTISENADGTITAVVGFSNTAEASAGSVARNLASLKADDFEKAGLSGVVVREISEPTLVTQYQELLSLSVVENQGLSSLSIANTVSLLLALVILLFTAF